MSDTPRTDEQCTLREPTIVPAYFARQLERENRELLEALDELMLAAYGVRNAPGVEKYAKQCDAALALASAAIAKATREE